MRPTKLQSTQLVRDLAALQQAAEVNMRFKGTVPGSLRGTIVDVNDPEKRGRVCVVFDDVNPNCPQVGGAGVWSESRLGENPDRSHWVDVSPAFYGTQPSGLVNKRVTISASNGQYSNAVVQDVLFDPQLLASDKQSKLKMPNNSSMTRLPCYESGKLPPASAENVGCMVVECGGPLQSDWLCVCLQRNGQYLWVRHIDACHGHAGQNDSAQPADSDGDSEQPVNNMTVWDYTFPTTAGEMGKYTNYGSSPRPNPFGGQANWIGPAT